MIINRFIKTYHLIIFEEKLYTLLLKSYLFYSLSDGVNAVCEIYSEFLQEYYPNKITWKTRKSLRSEVPVEHNIFKN
mgnify:CR=1 FL=1